MRMIYWFNISRDHTLRSSIENKSIAIFITSNVTTTYNMQLLQDFSFSCYLLTQITIYQMSLMPGKYSKFLIRKYSNSLILKILISFLFFYIRKLYSNERFIQISSKKLPRVLVKDLYIPKFYTPVSMLWDAKRNNVVIVTFVVFLFLNNSRVKKKTNFM